MIADNNSNKQITKESYQATAKEFARNVLDLAPMESIDNFLNLLPSSAKIIDLGCGSGRDAKIFSSCGAEVIGVDYCANLIDIATAYAPLANFKLMDIEEMNFSSCFFDGAWAACSLGHIEKKQLVSVLKNIHSLLTDNGYFYISVKKGLGEILAVDTRYPGNFKKFWSFFEEEELKNLLQLAGFKILDFALVEKNHPYQTQAAFRVFCQKS